MKTSDLSKLPPEMQLKYYLMQQGYPHKDIPYVLRYCPQLIQNFSIEEIAVAALSDINLFKPQRINLYIRPIIMQSVVMDLEADENVTEFTETALSIFANETIELTLTELINKLLIEKGLKKT